MALSSVWFKHLPEAEQQEFKDLVRSSHRVLERLLMIVEEKKRDIVIASMKEETYDAGYPYWQAMSNGRLKELNELTKILSFLEE